MGRRVFLIGLVAGGLLLAGAASDTSGQTFTGGLRGAVRDAQGVIPGATVTLVNEATNVSRETVTNEVGEYAFPAVVPGTYTIRTSLAGYRAFERRGVRVGTQQFVAIDILLEVGAIEEEITVTADAPLIETSRADTGATLDRRSLETLPTPGRNAFLLGVTAPTMIRSGDLQWDRQQDQTNASLISLGGGTRRGNNYLLDGFPITDMRNRAVVNPTIEALEEVKVQVHTYDAEMGRTGGGVFNVTGKSGTNTYRGTGLFQTRPLSLLENNFFSKRAGVPKPEDQYYRLYGYGVGGPVIRNRTFFWTSLEGYRSLTTRNGNLIFPTSRERRGDFSQTFDVNGNLVVIYDPLTTDANGSRQPFPGNVISANRINPVAARILGFVPDPDRDVSNGQANYFRQSEIVDRADMVTLKMDHKFSDRISLSGMYLWNRTDEPSGGYWEKNLFASPEWKLDRKINALVFNNTYVVSDTSVLTLRAGWNTFRDDDSVPHDFDPSQLGFNSPFLNSIAFNKFPSITAVDYGEVGTDDLAGWGSRTDIEWYTWGFNGTLSRLIGRHTWKVGADYRVIGLNTQAFGQGSGTFTFNRQFTQGPNALSPAASSGNAIADLLLGYPSSGSAPVSNPTEVFTRYYSGYIQDDWRVSSKLTLNYGVRFEREEGLHEKQDRFIVAFDRNAVSPLASQAALPADIVSLRGDGQIRGGLVYAGQNGFPTVQGDQPAVKVGPRAGVVYALSDRTVVRGGYGLFWAPWNYPYPGTENYGQRGFTAVTTMQQNRLVPITSLDNPFPTGLDQPTGSSQGLLTGTGSNMTFIDQAKGAPRVQQWSVDVQRELPANMALTLGYMGAAGDNLGLGGTIDSALNINELDSKYLALGNQLFQTVPNPFFGVADAGGFAARPTLELRQLLRPFPQFGNISMLQATKARNRYHAVVAQIEKRLSHGWAGRFNYTRSRLKDNQFGETNFYAARPGSPQTPYDLDAEYGLGLLDVPHKIMLAPIVQLPFGQGKRWATGGVAERLLGNWSVSAIVTLEAGFPIAISQTPNSSGLFSNTQRPNVGSADPGTSGSTIDRLGNYLNPAAWSFAAPFTFGNAPRTDDRVRTPWRNNLDVSFQKDFRTGGRTQGQFRIELLNATNTPKFRDFNTTLGAGTFGQITRQAGFMRITQISLRFTF